MAELKTRPTDQSVADFLNAVEPEQRRKDAWTILEMMERLTGSKARMWGSSIVGFGSYTYVNTTRKPAEWPLIGFSPRKANLTLYIMAGFSAYDALMARLGKHTTGKSCLYVKRLSDVDLDVLEDLIVQSIGYMRETYETH
ncbi:DUF1801 domain-containing protein [Pelagibacterium xiamenense]|uniref:DUF1801 domain-containing protein n=1 Tax=Pelagibacterium xiamenense TaxID=2901140 RepID=UPI001E2F3E96|nr:DUF1801 domain-containing protein [Pelagibacterium xiamenense]MCD7061135.1 DUF1801 domain-containing protein [Pelagibacterium xiamenense]